MEYTLEVRKKIIKFINKRTLKDKNNINTKLKILKSNPYPNKLLDIKKLSNSDFYRLRINDYRFIHTPTLNPHFS